MNNYYKKFAEILVNYSLEIKAKEKVIITGTIAAEPLIEEVYILLLKKGAYPFLRIGLNNGEELFYRYAQNHHFDYVSDISLSETEKADGFVRIMSSTNTKSLSTIDPMKQAKLVKTNKPLSDIMLKKNRWILTLFPTAAYAQDAEMGFEEFKEFTAKALFIDKSDPVKEWEKLKSKQAKVIDKLKGANKIRIVSDDTDLSLAVKGRKFVNSCGYLNMPSGEIYTGPIETSAAGYIKFSFPACYSGREVEGVYLEFNNGKVIKSTADKNEQFLHSMIDIDEGAKYIGEFAFGLNYGIQKFIKNILFDEKIGGTIHLALGNSYSETGGKNKSALHWDFIKDLRKTGEVYVDDKLFLKRGKIL